MKYALIYAVTTSAAGTFVWRWRTQDRRHKSSRSFRFYFECVEDARRSGYPVQLERARGPSAPDAMVGFCLK